MADYRVQPQGVWVLESCQNSRFPYRLQVFRGDKLWFTLRVQDRWPAANRNIFCLREEEPPDTDDPLDEVERVPITAIQARGPRVSLILDRPRYKRCDFLFLVKSYKNRPGKNYEQIYWMTQGGMTQRRSGARLVSTGIDTTSLSVSQAMSATRGGFPARVRNEVGCQLATTRSLMATTYLQWWSARRCRTCWRNSG